MQTHLPQHTLVLDIIHATEYLWDAVNGWPGDTHPDRQHWMRRGQLLLGDLYLATGLNDLAETHYLQALELAAAGDIELQAEAHHRLWQQHGQHNAARDQLQAIIDRFSEGWDTPDLREAIALRDLLSDR
jgi:hypothetical protein